MGPAAPYQTLAPYYDWVMSHVEYPEWAEYLDQLLKYFKKKPTMVLELAAGTCSLSKHLQSQWKEARFVFSDLSYEMLKATPFKNLPLKRVNANALSLPFKPSFDLCLMMYDSINYLLEEDEWVQCLTEVSQALLPGGIFIFDVTTEYNSRQYFSDSVLVEDREDCHITRESWYESDINLQFNQFIFFIKNKNNEYHKFSETHTQRVRGISDMRKIIKKTPFKVLKVMDDFTLAPAHRYSNRIHFVLQVL